MNKKLKLLEEIAKTTPIMIGSAALTVIAFPYALFGIFINSEVSSVGKGGVYKALNFLQNDKLLNAWTYGFDKFADAIREYREIN